MGADRWSECPQCAKNAAAAKAAALKKADELYGKVPADEWTKMVEAANQAGSLDPTNTLREDYGFTLENGEVEVEYYCSCKECGFKHNFKHVEKLPLKDQ